MRFLQGIQVDTSSLQLELRGIFGAEDLEVESLIHKVASSFFFT